MTVKVIKVDGGNKQENATNVAEQDNNIQFRKIDVVEVSDSESENDVVANQNNANVVSEDDNTDTDSEEYDEDDSEEEDDSEDEDSEDEEDDDEDTEETTEDGGLNEEELLNGGAGSDTVSSVSTTEILGKYPLFLVLTEFLMDDEGNNIVHVLHNINKNLAKIAKRLGSADKKKLSKDRA